MLLSLPNFDHGALNAGDAGGLDGAADQWKWRSRYLIDAPTVLSMYHRHAAIRQRSCAASEMG